MEFRLQSRIFEKETTRKITGCNWVDKIEQDFKRILRDTELLL